MSAEIESQNFQQKISVLVREARRLGIEVLPPDIEKGNYRFQLDGEKRIIYGLGAIKNVGEAAVREIENERRRRPFRDFRDFVMRVDPSKVNKKVVESLIKAGAFDCFDKNRRKLLDSLPNLYSKKERGKLNQIALFAQTKEEKEEKELEWTIQKKLAFEKETLGFFLTGHPLDAFKDKLEGIKLISSSSLSEYEDGKKVKIAGTLVQLSRKRDRQGKIYANCIFEDYEGEFGVIFFSSLYEEVASILNKEESYLITGRVSWEEEEKVRIIAETIKNLEDVKVKKKRRGILLKIGPKVERETIKKLKEILLEFPGPLPLYVEIKGEKFKSKSLKLEFSPSLKDKLEKLLQGKGEILILYEKRIS